MKIRERVDRTKALRLRQKLLALTGFVAIISMLPWLAAPAPAACLAGGYNHSLGVRSNGSVVAWGYNGYGEGTVPAAAQSGVFAVASGAYHSVALMANGSVVAWGDNQWSQCNVPAAAQSGVIAVATVSSHSLALKADSSVVAWGWNFYGQINVPAAAQSGVIAVATGGVHSLALKADGTVVAWGRDLNGQCDVPAGLSGVIAVAGGGDHSLALKADGSVVAWGDNQWSQCNVPAAAQSGVIAVAGGGRHSLALKADGSVVAWGHNGYKQCTVPAAAQSEVIAVAAGYYYSLALKADGTVVAWGENDHGECTVPCRLSTGPGVCLNFDDFHNLGLITREGNAGSIANPVYYNNRYVLRLTNNYQQASSAYYIRTVNLLAPSFSTRFSFQITNPAGLSDSDGVGGDGIVFIIQAHGLYALGSAGGKLAYNGIKPSIAIEFDTYDNTVDGGDDKNNNGNHISVNLNGVLNPLAQYNVPTRMNNGAIWYAWIDYIARTHSLQIRISQSSSRPSNPQLTYNVNLPQIFGTNQVYIGFTSSTGNGKQTQDILSWHYTSPPSFTVAPIPLLLLQ